MASSARVAMTTYGTKPAVLADDRVPPTSELQSIKEIGINQTPEPKPVALKERIRLRAWEIYLARNGKDGSETEDWLQAEQEICCPGTSPAS